MSEKFLSMLDYVSGNVAYNIWLELNTAPENYIDTEKSMKEFFDFFAFAISKNIIIEYDSELERPIFSGDLPRIVANRIFCDFRKKNPNIPKICPSDSDDFVAYMIYKKGWAVLYQGTRLILPET